MKRDGAQCLMLGFFHSNPSVLKFRADSRFVLSQWETALLCNDVSHWLGARLVSALKLYHCVHDLFFSMFSQSLCFSIGARFFIQDRRQSLAVLSVNTGVMHALSVLFCCCAESEAYAFCGRVDLWFSYYLLWHINFWCHEHVCS